MGLDSVYLLMQFEKVFKKEVPDEVASTIYTVDDMANWFYQNKEIYEPDLQIESKIFELVKKTLVTVGLTNQISYEQKLNEIIPKHNLEQTWREIERILALKIPKLSKQELANREVKEIKFFGLTLFIPQSPFLENSIERFILCIAALNYKKFVDFDRITSLYEIKIAIIGITSEKNGIAVEEIFGNSCFVNDLGID